MNPNNDRLRKAFSTGLSIPIERIIDDLAYNSISEWDSVAHMVLVSTIEEEFGIMLDTNEILDLSSVGKAKQILQGHDLSFS